MIACIVEASVPTARVPLLSASPPGSSVVAFRVDGGRSPGVVAGREYARSKDTSFKVKQGFWGMPRGSVPMKDVPSGDTR